MRRGVLCVTLAAALGPSSVGAQPLVLTEAEVLARLSPDSARVRAIRAPMAVAQVDVLSAGRWPNPRLTVDRESVAGTTEYLTMVAQPLPITGRRGLETDAATAQVSAASSRVDDQMRRLRADLRMAFAQLVAAQNRERELAAAGDRLRTLAELLARREAAGDAAGFDRLRAEREVLDMETDAAVAATERARAQGIVASVLADPPDPSRLVAEGGVASVLPDLPSLDVLMERAEATRGELAALRHESDAAAFAARAADRRLVPEPEVIAGTKSSTFGGGDIGSVVTVVANIPLFDHAKPERALAAARAAQATAQADSFRLALRGQIAALRTLVEQRRVTAQRYRDDAVNSAVQIERIAQVSYDAGERSILELLDAYRIGATARTRQVSLDAAVKEAEIELEFASGWEIR
jgi:cobalt-zinc-cadmium efflux system outer membrane protein